MNFVRLEGCHILRTSVTSLSSHKRADGVIDRSRTNARSYLRLNRGAAQEGRSPEILWEDPQQQAESWEGTFGLLRPDDARPCQFPWI